MKTLLRFFILIAVSVLSFQNLKAQSGCATAIDLNITPVFNIGNFSAYDPSINYGCVPTSGQYFVYGYFEVCLGGNMTIYAWNNNSSNDADIVVWGPFSTVTNICSNLTAGNIAGCAATSNPMDTVGLTTQTGDIYMVCIVSDTNTLAPSIAWNGMAIVNSNCSVNTSNNCAALMGEERFCLVTVDSATQKYKLSWEKRPPNPVSYFEIYKYGLNNQLVLVDTVNYNSYSEYIDMSSNPAMYAERYELFSRDTCGTGWSLGTFVQDAFCQASLSSSNTINLNWSPYLDQNNQVAYYVIYRGTSMTNMVPIDSVPDFINMYTDLNPLSGISYYKIGTALTNWTCVPSRMINPAVQSFSNSQSVQVTGLSETNELKQIQFFPNPTNGTLQLKGVKAETVLSVCDMSGRVVFEKNLNAANEQTVDLTELEQGIYQLRFSNEKGTAVQSLVISE